MSDNIAMDVADSVRPCVCVTLRERACVRAACVRTCCVRACVRASAARLLFTCLLIKCMCERVRAAYVGTCCLYVNVLLTFVVESKA